MIFTRLCQDPEARGPGSRRLPRSARNRIGARVGSYGREFRPVPWTSLEETATRWALTVPLVAYHEARELRSA